MSSHPRRRRPTAPGAHHKPALTIDHDGRVWAVVTAHSRWPAGRLGDVVTYRYSNSRRRMVRDDHAPTWRPWS